MLKPLVSKFRPDLLARLIDIAEKQVPANLKPIAVHIYLLVWVYPFWKKSTILDNYLMLKPAGSLGRKHPRTNSHACRFFKGNN